MLNVFTDADIARLVAIIKELTGNNVQEKNFPMIKSRLKAHMLKLGLPTVAAYWDYYEANEAQERHVLQGLMTTHYTFFFREYAHFEVLEQWLEHNITHLKQRFAADTTPVKVWSAACSRGQEVYSLAMFLEFTLLKKHGIPYKILGTDIDAQSIEYARNGVYPIKEVNTIPQKYLNDYWKKGTGTIKDFAAVHPRLRECTEFQKTNLLEIPASGDKFDIIFARNVFIYFSEDNVRKVALDLRGRLFEGGLFVSGISEPLRFAEWDLESPSPCCYINRKKAKVSTPAHSATPGVVAKSVISALPTALRYKVLCVDDSTTIQILMKKIFAQDPNCSGVVTVTNGLEASQKLKNDKFDLITLDIHMPVMTGIEFLEKEYKRNQHPPVLMISSVNRKDIDLATKSIQLGAFDYVEKPAMNNLQKSVDEILTKAKMALRSKATPTVKSEADGEDFNKSIGQKIVVPDASQCLRWVKTSQSSLHLLEPIVRLQSEEYRSPAMVISAPEEDLSALETKIVDWSKHKIERLRTAKHFLKPNSIYLCASNIEKELVPALKIKSFSLQMISLPTDALNHFSQFANIQVLLDESLAGKGEIHIRTAGLELSDITPSTSFVSLSLEFFANLRKVKAA